MATQLTVILASGSLVDIDATLLIQLGVFLFMLIVLRSLLFKPVIRLIEARHSATVGTMQTASDLQKEANKLTADFNEKMAEVRTEASSERNRILERAKQVERKMVGEAKETADQMMLKMREQAEGEMKDTLANLESETRAMATLLAEKVLERQL